MEENLDILRYMSWKKNPDELFPHPIIQQTYLSLYFFTFLSCREHLLNGSYHLFINLYLQMGKKIRKNELQKKPRKNNIFLIVFSL